MAVFHDARDVTPLLTGAAYSEGGDLVAGYGFSRFSIRPDGAWILLGEKDSGSPRCTPADPPPLPPA